jgi:hypothetical protein
MTGGGAGCIPSVRSSSTPTSGWSLADRLQLLAFGAQLAHLPRFLIPAVWEALDLVAMHTPKTVRNS